MQRTKLLNLFLAYGYWFLLTTNYARIGHTHFDWLGFDYVGLGVTQHLMSIVIIGVLLGVLPGNFQKPSAFVAHLFFLLLYCPVLVVLFSTANFDSPSTYGLILALSLTSVILGIVPYAKPLALNTPRIESGLLVGIVLCFSLLFYALLFQTFGFRMPVGILDVYDTRLEAREIIAAGPPGIGYIMRWLGSSLNPFVFLVGLLRRNVTLVLFGVVGQIIVYAFDATKMTLVSLMAVFAIWWLVRYTKASVTYFYALISAFVALVWAADVLLGGDLLNFLLIRRIFFMPATATAMYFDTFSYYEPFYWTSSLLSPFIEPIHPFAGPPFMVGQLWFGSAQVSANANVFADAFANGGILGMWLVAGGLAVFLWFYDSLSRNVARELSVPQIVVPSMAMLNSALPSSFLTHGLLVSLVLIAVVYVKRSVTVTAYSK